MGASGEWARDRLDERGVKRGSGRGWLGQVGRLATWASWTKGVLLSFPFLLSLFLFIIFSSLFSIIVHLLLVL